MSRTSITQTYSGASAATDAVLLVADQKRSAVRVKGKVTAPIALREALSVLHEVVASDLRYKPKDRTAYLAYQRMKKQSTGGLAAQAAYFDWLARNDPDAWFVLDPVVTVNPDAVVFEVFSKDEGTYAQLSIDKSLFEVDGDWVCGTTNIDFSDALVRGVQGIRSYRELHLTLAPDAVTVEAAETVVEKKVPVPDSWLRGFLQVSTSASLSRATVDLAPIDLYNLLRHLRLNADHKRKGRAIRVELVPGEAPRLVLEPWEEVLETESAYTGSRPEVVRIWGRRRWTLMRRFLPFTQSATLHLLGSGLPSFLVLKGEGLSLTLGLTGFTSANWSRALAFDALLPQPDGSSKVHEKVLAHLGKKWSATHAELQKASKGSAEEVHQAVQALALQGAVMIDLAAGTVRLRPLTDTPVDPEKLKFRSEAERKAHDLVGSVKIGTENVVHGEGTQLAANIKDDARTYRTAFTLDEEGRVSKCDCTCTQFRTHRLKEGPCPHLLALRMKFEDLKRQRASRRGSAVRVETRTYAKRTADGESITQLSLNNKRLKVRWGLRTAARLRVQNLVFDDVDTARTAYFERIAALESKGYLDASAS